MEISDYAHFAVFLSLLLKWNLWLRSLHCFTSLLLKWYLWLPWLHCFTFTTIKMKSLTMLTALFYFTTTNPRDRTIFTTLLLSFIHQIVFPQEFQCFNKICMCHSNFTVRKLFGVLHALLLIFLFCNALLYIINYDSNWNWTFENCLSCIFL